MNRVVKAVKVPVHSLCSLQCILIPTLAHLIAYSLSAVQLHLPPDGHEDEQVSSRHDLNRNFIQVFIQNNRSYAQTYLCWNSGSTFGWHFINSGSFLSGAHALWAANCFSIGSFWHISTDSG